ncbi:hypothetical protein LSAT2_026949 [Lamellibrachia satsuma]|nr:hypothetical protein LSAT2_026949 [Lamellibrachia satsuma]
MEVDMTRTEETSSKHHTTSTYIELPGEEKKRKAAKHLAERHRKRKKEDGDTLVEKLRKRPETDKSGGPCVAPVSTLYIDHLDPLNTTVVDVDLDLMRRLEDVTVLLENVMSRNMSIDVCQLASDYRIMMSKLAEKTSLEEEREGIARRMKTLVKEKQSSPEVETEKEKLKERGKRSEGNAQSGHPGIL